MIRPRHPEAERLERDYLERARRALASHPDGAAILEELRQHIEGAAAELPGPVGLAAMAAILERLGPPEAVAPEAAPAPVPPRPASATRPPAEEADWVERLRLACLVGVVGLYVPLIELHVCALISLALIAVAVQAAPARAAALRSAALPAWWAFALCLAMAPIAALEWLTPAAGLIGMPVGTAYLVLHLIVFWRLMGSVAELTAGLDGDRVRSRLQTARVLYLITTLIAVVVGGTIVGLLVGGSGPAAASLASLLFLPIGWLIGWRLVLRPLAAARDALRAAGAGRAPHRDPRHVPAG